MSGQLRLTVSARNRSSHIDDDILTPGVLHVTYYFRHVNVVKNNDTVYIVVIRIVDGFADLSRTLSSDSGECLPHDICAFCLVTYVLEMPCKGFVWVLGL